MNSFKDTHKIVDYNCPKQMYYALKVFLRKKFSKKLHRLPKTILGLF